MSIKQARKRWLGRKAKAHVNWGVVVGVRRGVKGQGFWLLLDNGEQVYRRSP